MPRTKEISYHRGITINTGQYTTQRIDVGEVQILEEGDDPENSHKMLRAKIIGKMLDDARKVRLATKEVQNDKGSGY